MQKLKGSVQSVAQNQCRENWAEKRVSREKQEKRLEAKKKGRDNECHMARLENATSFTKEEKKKLKLVSEGREAGGSQVQDQAGKFEVLSSRSTGAKSENRSLPGGRWEHVQQKQNAVRQEGKAKVCF